MLVEVKSKSMYIIVVYVVVHAASADLNPRTESALTTFGGKEFHTMTVLGKYEYLYVSVEVDGNWYAWWWK